jgi:predicted PurR-regulated permease PerM
MAVFGTIFLAGLALFLLWPASQIFLIIFASILLAVFVNALASLVPRRLAIPMLAARLGVIVLLVLLLAVFFWVAGPSFSDQMSRLSEQLPQALEYLQKMVSEKPWSNWLHNLPLARLRPDATQIISGVTGVFSTAFGVVVNVIIILFIGLYFAVQPELYLRGFLCLIPRPGRDRARQLLQALDHALSLWILGRVTSMVLAGVLTAVGLKIIAMPLALVLGVISGLLTFVPYVGPIAALIPAVLVGMLQSHLMAAKVLIVYSLIQFTEGYFLTPMIQRRAISLPPAILLLAQLCMGIFYGLFGLALATPMAVVVIVIIQVLYVHHVIGDPVPLLGQHGRDGS